MKHFMTLAILLAFATSIFSQEIDLHLPKNVNKRPGLRATGYVLSALAGVSNGFNQAWVAEPTRWGTGDGFWEQNSWKRKYEDYDAGNTNPAFIGSKSFNVWATDGFHLTSAFTKTALVGATVSLTIGERPSWRMARRVAIGGAIYGLTSHGVYNQIRFGRPW